MHGAIDASRPALHTADAPAPLVAHLIFQLTVGGLENGLVNLINHMPPARYRHAIICLKDYTDFRDRIARRDVEVIALNKKEGNDLQLYVNLFRTLRRLRPAILHTRNLAALEGQVIAALAGVRARVHGEHGRDMLDLDGSNRKYRLLRKALTPFADHVTTVSRDLETWLVDAIGIRPAGVTQIYNGVDSERFRPRIDRELIGPAGFMTPDCVVVGSVGRMAAVKDFPNLVRAFLTLLDREPENRARLRLLIVGEGESRSQCLEMLRSAGAQALAWLPGVGSDTDRIMRAMDMFVLPSLGEGISNTILEAMATGLPVIATRVGGNAELVDDGICGRLVPPANPDALADALSAYGKDGALRARHGAAARRRIEANFSMDAMTHAYMQVYDRVLRQTAG